MKKKNSERTYSASVNLKLPQLRQWGVSSKIDQRSRLQSDEYMNSWFMKRL